MASENTHELWKRAGYGMSCSSELHVVLDHIDPLGLFDLYWDASDQLCVDRAPLEAKGNKPVSGMTFIPTLQCFPGEDSYCHTN